MLAAAAAAYSIKKEVGLYIHVAILHLYGYSFLLIFYCLFKIISYIFKIKILALQSELNLLKELSQMTHTTEKQAMLFEILDKNGDGKLSKVMLAEGLQQIRGDQAFKDKAVAASDFVAAFETNNRDGMLDPKEFEVLLTTLLPMMGCSFQELSEILVLQVLFSKQSLLTTTTTQDAVMEVVSPDTIKENLKGDKELRLAMKDVRMKALFDVFDQNGAGVVDFQELVVGLYKIMDDIDTASRAAVTALLLFDKSEKRELLYHEFAKLMLNIVASSLQNVTFDDVADTLTRNAISVSSGITAEYVLEKFSMDKKSKLLLDIANDNEDFQSLGVVELTKLDRLFAMFDKDKDGKIDAKDLALGLAKFHETTGVEKTLEESAQVMKAFDRNADGMLGHHDFSAFIVTYAAAANMNLLDMLDFMIVVMVLKENNVAQEEYILNAKKMGEKGILDVRYG